eukprot:TRINITY_DN16958_c0_g1_i1.p1 TRINITY_DN16958_c0_g1~~TRINITY_DN16958_c0_g1_i1.p1  ORF type:complete len:195 (-),score=44.96 TRINITY_DN16958_c0_g1_i1:72-656(-)
MSAKQNFEEYKLVVIGRGGVGKSAITMMFLQGRFVSKYDPTVEDSYRHMIEVDGTSCTLDIMDTAGQEEFVALQEMYMKNGEGFLLVYSISSEESFNAVESLKNRVNRSQPGAQDLPVLILANKCDLVNDREVSKEAGAACADKLGCGFMEVSAKNNIGITDAFIRLVKEINDWRVTYAPKKQVKQTKRKCVLY